MGTRSKDKIRAVLFDWGDVLMFYDGLYRECARHFDCDEASFKAAFKEYEPLFEEGMDEMQIWSNVAKKLGKPAPAEPIWRNAFESVYNENTGLFSLISKLKTEGYKVGLVTNTETALMNFIKEKESYEIFDMIAYSCEPEIMSRKPKTKIFDIACKRLGIPPNQAVFIDNNSDNVAAFQIIGGKGIIYNGQSPEAIHQTIRLA